MKWMLRLVLDKLQKTTMKKNIKVKLGPQFQILVIIIGIALTALGIGIIKDAPLTSAFFILLGLFLSAGTIGTEFSFENKKFRQYSNYFGIKIGKWQSFSNYIHVSILSQKIAYKLNSRGNSMQDSELKYDVVILTENHRQKVIIKRCNTVEEAKSFALKLSEQLDMKLVKYTPKISKQSQLKRRR